MIIAAAIRHKGKTYALPAPARHHDVIHHIVISTCGQSVGGDSPQGFIDSEKGFVGRHEAFKIVVTEQQKLRDGKKEPEFPHHGLFSEDLW